MAKLSIGKNLLPAGAKIQLTMKSIASGEEKSYLLSSGDDYLSIRFKMNNPVITLKAEAINRLSDNHFCYLERIRLCNAAQFLL